ncbi:MAG: sigma-54-dependent Fis family transcriptional regulator [Hyphomicrobiaceae bacterium]
MVDTFPKSAELTAIDAISKSFIQDLLAQSRTRCEEAYRLDRSRRAGPYLLTPGELRCVAEPLELLTRVARPELEALLARLAPASYVVVLSDANGVAVDFVASGSPDRKLWRMGVCAGAAWGEPHVGTNGIGTSIMSRLPIIVHQRNHFLLKYAELTCAAAPLFDARGRVIASLDASSVANLPQEIQGLVLDLVVRTARRIERLYFLERYRDRTILTVDLGNDGLSGHTVTLAVGEDGCVIDAQGNSNDGSDAPTLDTYSKMNFANVVDLAWRTPAVQAGPMHVEHKAVVNLVGDLPYFTVLRAPAQLSPRPMASVARADLARSKPKKLQPISKPVLTLERLAGDDPGLCAVAGKIDRFIAHRIPFLIQGETGTGKEEFARAIHAKGPRAASPFVAIDCSSIPENLIESELFGYEAGSFTGAKREGQRGRILDANAGTLFLDEIGDMPLTLQTRLLRVLARNEVVPLGGHVPIKVDFNLICATHQDLKTMVERKSFRQDLYFRISGCRIALPPLRERCDKKPIIIGALELECYAVGIRTLPDISEAAMQILTSYPWPGNMRQARLAMRFALASSGGEEIFPEHLPEEIVEEASGDDSIPKSAPTPEADLEDVLRRNAWSVSQTARDLNVSRQTVHRWMKERDLKRPVS